MATSPLPDLSLIKMKRYSTMTVQYSRGCPFNCEFCDIIEIYGRRADETVAQVLAELINCSQRAGASRCSSWTTILSATNPEQKTCCARWRVAHANRRAIRLYYRSVIEFGRRCGVDGS